MMARARRRTVRIVKPKTGLNPTTLSLLAAVSVAVILFLVWRFWQEDEPPAPVARTVQQVPLDWLCTKGHEFTNAGQPGARVCPTCKKPAFPKDTYVCSQHGAFTVFVELAVQPEGYVGPKAIRIVGKKAWIPIDEPLICPRCKRELTRARRDPFSRRPKGRNKPDK